MHILHLPSPFALAFLSRDGRPERSAGDGGVVRHHPPLALCIRGGSPSRSAPRISYWNVRRRPALAGARAGTGAAPEGAQPPDGPVHRPGGPGRGPDAVQAPGVARGPGPPPAALLAQVPRPGLLV